MLKWQNAKALIDEIKRLRCKRNSLLIERLEAMQPAILTPHDEVLLIAIYRYATGGGERILYHRD